MVLIRPIQAERGIDIGGIPNTRVDSSVAEGLQALGGAVRQAGNVLADIDQRRAEMKAQADEFRTDQSFLRFSDDMSLEFAKLQQDIDPSGEGFTDTLSTRFNEKAGQFLQSVPPQFRGKYEEKVRTAREIWINRAAASEVDQRNKWYETSVAERANTLAAQVAQDPSLFDDSLSDGEGYIDATGLPQTVKAEAKKSFRQQLERAKAGYYERVDPDYLLGPQAQPNVPESLLGAIEAEESSSNPNAVSKKGATGVMQVMPDTAREIARELGDANFPANGSDKEVQEYLKNADVSRQYGRHYFGKMLDRYNGDVEAALVAYNAGPGRADKWLNSGRDDGTIPQETRDYKRKVMNRAGTGGVQPAGVDLPIVTRHQSGRVSAPDMSGVQPAVLERFKQVQNAFGRTIPIVSGYRDPARNKRAGGAKRSHHMHGNALDLDVSDMSHAQRVELIKTASALGFTGIGVYGNSIHLDMGSRRAWGPSHHDDSIPGWAKAAISEHLAGKAQPTPGAGGQKGVYLHPDFASLPLDERLKIYDQAVSASKARRLEADAQLKAKYEATKGALELGIQTGEITSVQQILSSEMSDAHKADLISALRTRQKEQGNIEEAVRLFGAGALTVDPYDSKSEKTVDGVWDVIRKSAEPDQWQSVAENLIGQTGVVPQQIVNEIRRALTSGSVQEIAEAAQAAQRFAAVDPAALSRRAGGGEVQKIADDFAHYVNHLNLSPDEAAKKVKELRDPEKQRDRKALEPAAKEFLKEMADVDIAAAFDDSFLGWRSNPALGVTPQQEAGIKADFLALAEEAFYQANGEPEVAQNRALEQMKRLYGVSEITGKPVVMKHPPERYWPKSTLGVENTPSRIHGTGAQGPAPEAGGLSIFGGGSTPSLDYVKKQLESDVKTLDPNVDLSTVQLVTTPETDAMVKRGELPGYAILYRDASGMYQTIPGKLWRPEVSQAVKAQQEVDEVEQAERVERAREMQEIERFKAEEQGDDGGRSRSLDAFIDGPVTPPAPPQPQAPETPASQIEGQRRELFDNAKQMGTLSPMDVLSGNDPVFGAR